MPAKKLTKLPGTVRGRDYIETRDWTVKEIDLALETASKLKKAFKQGKPTRYLPDKTVFLFFFDKSTTDAQLVRGRGDAARRPCAFHCGRDVAGRSRGIAARHGDDTLELRTRDRDQA